jgi:uncharacterized protein YqgV (UPF0045/DUF77 family)
MTKIINTGIQVIPLNIADPAYAIVDKAIEHIKKSGLQHMVTPFETIVNGTMEQTLLLIAELKKIAESNGADELIINVRFHSKKKEDCLFENKLK